MRTHVRWIVPMALVTALVFAFALVPWSLRAAPVQRHVTTCAGSGAGSLADIVGNVAQSGDTVVFDQDCSDTANTPITLSGTVNIASGKNLTIDALASAPPHTVIIDGNHASQILRLQAAGNHGPTVTLNGLTLRNGSTTDRGGAIFNDQGALTITNSAILTNTAAVGGGGIENAGGTLTATNATFNGNRVTGTGGATGGAIDNNRFGKLTLTSVTISGNTVSSTAAQSAAGGGVFDFSQGANAVTLSNALVAGNTGGNCNGADIGSENTTGLASGGHNLIGVRHNVPADTTCGVDFLGLGGAGDLIGTDDTPIRPLLGAPGLFGGRTAVLPLLPGSPALDTGGATCPGGATTDQRGSVRPVNGACDIGAFESGGFTLTTTGGNNQTAAISTAFGQPLAVTVGAKANGEPVAGGSVTFGAGTAPGGATATLSAPQATIGMSGQASVTATANDKIGMYQVTASAAGASTTTLTLTNTTALILSPTTLPAATIGITYSATITVSGGTGTGNTFALAPGSTLPIGLVLNATTGVISGTPTATGMTSFTITVTDNGANMGSRMYTLSVNAATVTALAVTAPSGAMSGNGGTATMPVLRAGTSLALNVVGSFNNGTTGQVNGVTYTSSNPNVVAVDPTTGLVTAISGGTATITVSGPNGVTSTIIFTVTGGSGGGLMNPNPQPMAKPGGTVVPGATIAPQPNRAPTGGQGAAGGMQPQAAGTQATAPTATPLPQPPKR